MQYKLYQRREGNEELILFFNGWAMTPETVEHLAVEPHQDLLIVWDYRDLSLDFDFGAYQSIQLFAWSMGVWAVDSWYVALDGEPLPITQAVAICGTGYPMSDERGIPNLIFQGTLESVSPENRLRFNRRMCGGKRLKHLFEALSKRSTQEIKSELQSVYDAELKRQESVEGAKTFTAPWSKAIVGMKDRIIPAENQKRYWQEQGVELVSLPDEDHYIFGSVESWTCLGNKTEKK